MKITRIAIAGLLLISMLLMLVTPASAADWEYSFYSITDNNPGDAAIGEEQLRGTVGAVVGSNQVRFTFYNDGPLASSITDIYFDDLDGISGLLETLVGVSDTGPCRPGVDFEMLASPPNLPGGNEIIPPFIVTDGFSVQSVPPRQPCGVNPGESVKIIFTLRPGVLYADIVTAIESGDLRIGIHVQGFESGGSESFITHPPTAITLASFTARDSGNQATLNWVTGSEISNAGFNLYRASDRDATRVKVNAQLLAATGDAASGASYQFVDTPGYGTFYYWLEDVEFTGKTSYHGPLSLTLAKPVRRPVYRPVSPVAR